jgi:hypothetical protein
MTTMTASELRHEYFDVVPKRIRAKLMRDLTVADLLALIDEDLLADISYLPSIDKWILKRDYYWYDAKRDRQMVIPRGFVFDLASIPKQLWWAIGPHQLSVEAALVHDWLYAHAGHLPGGVVYTRHEADLLFLEMMRGFGIRKTRRLAAYHAVRIFGPTHFRPAMTIN